MKHRMTIVGTVRNIPLLLRFTCVAILFVGGVLVQYVPPAPAAEPSTDPGAKPSAETATEPSEVKSETRNRLMAEIELLSTASQGNASCSFEFQTGEHSVILTLTTQTSQVQTVEMPAALRFWDEGSRGDRTIFIQGSKFFACGSYPGGTARELVVKLRELNEVLRASPDN